MTARPRFESVDEYVDAAEPKAREILQAIRNTVAKAVPDATECISHQMPALRRKKVLLYFAAFKKHIGVYPPVQDPDPVAELARYRAAKGNLQFPPGEPMPYPLIARIARSLARQCASAPR